MIEETIYATTEMIGEETDILVITPDKMKWL